MTAHWAGHGPFMSILDVEEFLIDVRAQAQADIDTVNAITERWQQFNDTVINMGAALNAGPGVDPNLIKGNIARLRREAGDAARTAHAASRRIGPALTNIRTGCRVMFDLCNDLRKAHVGRSR